MPHYELGGSVAIVTGGGRGIGDAVCRRLAAEGADVAIFDIDEAAAGATAAKIVAAGGPSLSGSTSPVGRRSKRRAPEWSKTSGASMSS